MQPRDPSNGPAIRLAIVDDHAGARHGLALLLARTGFEVIAEAGDAEEALDQLLRHRPDVALVDLRLPGASGIALAKEAIRWLPDLRVLIYTGASSPDLAALALDAGAAGVVLKDASTSELTDALRRIAAGETVVDGRLTNAGAVRGASLTAREREVLELLAAGRSTRQIAAELFLSATTVSTHMRNAMRRMGARTRAQAVAAALRDGVIESPARRSAGRS